MKHIFTYILAILVSLCAVSTALASEFTDVPVTHPMHEYITYLSEHGYVSGYEDGTFKPDRTVTRAEVLKFALGARGDDLATSTNLPFSDVPSDAWYYSYVVTAYTNDIVSGYEDGTFKPDRTVTRAEGLKIILNALNAQLPESYTADLKDVPADTWYALYAQYVLDFNILGIEGGEFKPDSPLKRQDVAELIYNFVKAEEIARTTLNPWGMWGLFVLLYGMLSLTVWQLSKDDTRVWIFTAFGPFVIWYVLFRMIKWSIPRSETFMEDEVVSHRKQYAYFKKPRKVEKLFFLWIDTNMKSLLGLWSVFLIWNVMVFIVITQIATMQYIEPFITFTETYGTYS